MYEYIYKHIYTHVYTHTHITSLKLSITIRPISVLKGLTVMQRNRSVSKCVPIKQSCEQGPWKNREVGRTRGAGQIAIS